MKKIYYDSSNNKLCGILTNYEKSDKVVIMCHGIRGNKDECGAFVKLSEELLKIGYNKVYPSLFQLRFPCIYLAYDVRRKDS